MFGLSSFKRLIDSLYTYSYDKKSKKGTYMITVETTDDFDLQDLLQTILECMKTTQEMWDKIQYNLRIFEIQDPAFKKLEFNDASMMDYLF